VITLFRKRREENNPHILLYLGASYLEMNDFQQAQAVFEQLLTGDTLDSHKAYWYLALVYLKQGSVEKAKEQLLLVRQNPANYGYEQANALLEELDR
ncbi:MAG: tetratricopeptide repeat protein, partial [Bacteroidota bacterium]